VRQVTAGLPMVAAEVVFLPKGEASSQVQPA
jgi:hypothetical protein